MELVKKIKTYFWYNIGKKELSFNDKVPRGFIPLKMIPDVVFERDCVVYNVGWHDESSRHRTKGFTVLIGPSPQAYNV